MKKIYEAMCSVNEYTIASREVQSDYLRPSSSSIRQNVLQKRRLRNQIKRSILQRASATGPLLLLVEILEDHRF